MEITTLLTLCANNQASDLHLSPGMPPLLRIHGDLRPLDDEQLEAQELEHALLSCMPPAAKTQYGRQHCCDFRWHVGRQTHCRVHIYRQIHGMAATFRLIAETPPTIEQLGLPTVVRQIASAPHGLVLVTGACGSGKSTTLAALIDFRNSTSACHILTLEQPVEYLHISKHALVSQRELDPCARSYAQALSSALREDPDIILVGEMRDSATIALALEAAETGHLVLSSLHTGRACEAIMRIVGSFPAAAQETIRQQLSLSLVAIIAQVLPKTLDGQGRIAAHEILLASSAVRNLIRENRLAQIVSQIQSGRTLGMQTLEHALQQLVSEQKISRTEALLYLAETE
jgi:twitching motility protein PilT